MMAAPKRKWGYKYFPCSQEAEAIIQGFAEKNKRKFGREVQKTVYRAYGIPDDEPDEVLPPHIAMLDKPTQDRPGRRPRTAA
jgi:hypothetical protein